MVLYINNEVLNMNTVELTYKEKNLRLFFEQKKTLDLFLERGAISKAQHDKSLGDLIEKMNITDLPQEILSDDEKIDAVARKWLEEHKEAFRELAR